MAYNRSEAEQQGFCNPARTRILMEILGINYPGRSEELDACREMAAEASINCTYFVSRPTGPESETVHILSSLGHAFDIWTNDPKCRLSGFVRWTVGDASGSCSVRYDCARNGKVSEESIASKFSDSIMDKIVDRLFKQLHEPGHTTMWMAA